MFSISFCWNVTGQNLVPNPSFEEYIACPDAAGNIEDDLLTWKSARGTPDFFHSCALDLLMSVPSNFAGHQNPIAGEGYIGLWTYSKTNPASATEAVGVQLTNPLTLGQTYYISFNYSLTYGTQGHNYTHDKLGVQFSMAEYTPDFPAPINNFTHLEASEIPLDSSIWVTINGSFMADAEYSHINVGNFYESSYVDTIGLEEENFRAYYYFDNICVSTDSVVCNLISDLPTIQQNDLVKLFLDPLGMLHVSNNGSERITDFFLCNAQGQVVYSASTISDSYQIIDLNSIQSQLLIGIAKTENSVYRYKLLKH